MTLKAVTFTICPAMDTTITNMQTKLLYKTKACLSLNDDFSTTFEKACLVTNYSLYFTKTTSCHEVTKAT